jgi:hypothetical protein
VEHYPSGWPFRSFTPEDIENLADAVTRFIQTEEGMERVIRTIQSHEPEKVNGDDIEIDLGTLQPMTLGTVQNLVRGPERPA